MQREIRFTIKGNQEDPKGNPIPYLRTTQRSSRFNEKAKRYHAWKDYVRFAAFGDGGYGADRQLDPLYKSYMSIVVFFANKKHADPDNIFKGIADAMFFNDKYLAGTFDYHYDKENPRVEVKILIGKEPTLDKLSTKR